LFFAIISKEKEEKEKLLKVKEHNQERRGEKTPSPL